MGTPMVRVSPQLASWGLGVDWVCTGVFPLLPLPPPLTTAARRSSATWPRWAPAGEGLWDLCPCSKLSQAVARHCLVGASAGGRNPRAFPPLQHGTALLRLLQIFQLLRNHFAPTRSETILQFHCS